MTPDRRRPARPRRRAGASRAGAASRQRRRHVREAGRAPVPAPVELGRGPRGAGPGLHDPERARLEVRSLLRGAWRRRHGAAHPVPPRRQRLPARPGVLANREAPPARPRDLGAEPTADPGQLPAPHARPGARRRAAGLAEPSWPRPTPPSWPGTAGGTASAIPRAAAWSRSCIRGSPAPTTRPASWALARVVPTTVPAFERGDRTHVDGRRAPQRRRLRPLRAPDRRVPALGWDPRAQSGATRRSASSIRS